MKTCTYCGKEVKERHSKFCNLKCFHEYLFHTKTCPRIEAGLCKDTGTLKNYLCKVKGEFCNLCLQGPMWNGKPLTLQVDHIDGNSDDSSPGNIRLVCPNCHTQTETFSTRVKKQAARNRYLRKFKGY